MQDMQNLDTHGIALFERLARFDIGHQTRLAGLRHPLHGDLPPIPHDVGIGRDTAQGRDELAQHEPQGHGFVADPLLGLERPQLPAAMFQVTM